MFKITPARAARASPERETVFQITIFSTAIPNTNISDAIIRFLELEKSNPASTRVRAPTAEIIPNNIIETPPITGAGIV